MKKLLSVILASIIPISLSAVGSAEKFQFHDGVYRGEPWKFHDGVYRGEKKSYITVSPKSELKPAVYVYPSEDTKTEELPRFVILPSS